MPIKASRNKARYLTRLDKVRGFRIEVGIIDGVSENYISTFPDGRQRNITDIVELANILMDGSDKNNLSPRPWIKIANKQFGRKFRRMVSKAVTNNVGNKKGLKKDLLKAAYFLRDMQIHVLENATSFGMDENSKIWKDYKKRYPEESTNVLRWSDHLKNNHKVIVEVF